MKNDRQIKEAKSGSEPSNVYPIGAARLGAHPSGFGDRDKVVDALSYPDALARAWRNYGWPFWADD